LNLPWFISVLDEKMKIQKTLILGILIVFVFLTPAFSETLINAPRDIVWEKAIKIFPKKLKIKKIYKDKYTIIAERKIGIQKKFNREIKIRLISRGEQTIITYDIRTLPGLLGFGSTKAIMDNFITQLKETCEASL